MIVRAGKGPDGGTYREVQLHRAAREAVRAWLDERPPPSPEVRQRLIRRRGRWLLAYYGLRATAQ